MAGIASFSSRTLRAVWLCLGWFGIVLLLYLSLAPQPPEIPLENGDKGGHALAYAVLTFWWAQLMVTLSKRLGLAVGFAALGVAIEYVQGWTGWRSFEYLDMLADLIGIVGGTLMAMAVPNMIALFTRSGDL